MALSDSCFEFLQAVGKAAEQLGHEAHYYSAPDHPLKYGSEIDALRRACVAAAESPYDPEGGARLIRLAAAVMRYHDTAPSAADQEVNRTKLKQLVSALQTALGPEDAAAVPAVVEQIAVQTPYTAQATKRLKVMLSKVGKATYDVSIKIISDVGAATAKKILGL